MTEIDPPITVEQLMAVTGLGPVQVRADVRAGILPGRIRKGKLILTAAEFRRWQAGEWTPRPQYEPTDFIRRRAS